MAGWSRGSVYQRSPYLVIAYNMRLTNQRKPRVFRYLCDCTRLSDAEEVFALKITRERTLRVELVSQRDMRLILEWGEPAVEDWWVDWQLSR